MNEVPLGRSAMHLVFEQMRVLFVAGFFIAVMALTFVFEAELIMRISESLVPQVIRSPATNNPTRGTDEARLDSSFTSGVHFVPAWAMHSWNRCLVFPECRHIRRIPCATHHHAVRRSSCLSQPFSGSCAQFPKGAL
jgi:hypothetical protein